MIASRSSVLERTAAPEGSRGARILSSLIRSRLGQQPAATYQEVMHSPIETTEAVADRALAETWGWN
jgi:hypothetical protein